MHRGSCLYGAVRFEVTGALPPPDGCHCSKCRKHSGHYIVFTEVPQDRLSVFGEDSLRWYPSSPMVRRGFCGTCGASLFFDPPQLDWIAIAMGAFDTPTGSRMDRYIFVADKGDYYDLTDGQPQNAQ